MTDRPGRRGNRWDTCRGRVQLEVACVDSVSDEGAVTTVPAGSVVLPVARVLGTPLGEGAHLSGTGGDSDDTSCSLSCVRSAPPPA